MGETPRLAPLAGASTVVAMEQGGASSVMKRDEQPAVVIAWLKSRLASAMNDRRADNDHHAAVVAELEDRLARTAAAATASDASVSAVTAMATAGHEASSAAKLALEVTKEYLSTALQERNNARATATELSQQLAATTAAANIAVGEAHRRESAARDKMEARQRELNETTGTIADLRQVIDRQSAVAADTAARVEWIRREATSATTAACAERDAATVAAAASAVAAATDQSKLRLATQEAARATSRANAFAEERDAANAERDRAVTRVDGLRADLEAQKTVATTATNELAAAAATIVALREALQQKNTTATTALAAAQQEASRATLSADEAVAECHAATRGRDRAVAATVDLQQALEVKTIAINTVTTKLTAVRREATRAVSAVTDAVRAAKSERDSAIAANDDLQEELKAQITANAVAPTALAAAQDEAARAISWANKAVHTAESERNSAIAANADLQGRLEVQTTAAAIATTALATAQDETARAISWANEAVHTAEGERNSAIAANTDLQGRLEVQTTAAATTTTALATAQEETARAISWANEVAARCQAAERDRDHADTVTTGMQAALDEKDAAATITANELAASRENVTRAVAFAHAAEQKLSIWEQERNHAASSSAEMKAALDQATATANNMAGQLANAANQLEAAQQEAYNASLGARTVIADRDRAIEERESILATAVEMHATINGMKKERGTLALQESNAVATGTAADVVPFPLASDPFGPPSGTLMLQERNAVAMETAADAIPFPLASDPFDPPRGTLALQESNATAMRTAADVIPFPLASDPFGPPRGTLALQESNALAMGTAADDILFPLASDPFGPPAAFGTPEDSVPAVGANSLVSFYRDDGRSTSGTGGQGPSLTEMLEQSDSWLEQTHDYIQWLFPTQQASRMVPNAPVLSDTDIVELGRNGEKPQRNMVSALGRMLKFYGLTMGERWGMMLVEKGGNFDPNAKWMEASDHNALRLTRIISSLRAFQLNEYADALQAFLCDLPELRGHPSREFWWSA